MFPSRKADWRGTGRV